MDDCTVLIIDALDEAIHNGRNELASASGNQFHRLPPWLRLIVTIRPYETEINFALQSLDPWKLDAQRTENLDDIRKCLAHEPRMFTGGPSKHVVDTILKKSKGLFLYVSWVRQELDDGRLSLEDVERFPRGLGGIYKDFLERYFPDPDKSAPLSNNITETDWILIEPSQFGSMMRVSGPQL